MTNAGFQQRRQHLVCWITTILLLISFTNNNNHAAAFVSQKTRSTSSFRTVSSQERLLDWFVYQKSNAITRRTSQLSMVAKTGGKIIKSIDEYSDVVLGLDVPRPVLVFFTAPWCGPCRLTIPVVKEILKQYSGEIDGVEVCTDDLAEIASECGVQSIPTIQFYYGGELYDTVIGCVAKSVLSGCVTAVLEDVKEQEKLNSFQRQQERKSSNQSNSEQ